MMHISVVIPVYKAEDCLDELYSRLKLTLETITPNFEILLVEDCGGDRSWELICELAQKDSRVKGIQFSRNFGQHYGITAGLDHCKGEWVVVMDCDLQDQPEEIPKLYQKAQEGYDVVLASRGRRCDPLLKRMTSWMFYKVFNYLSGLNYDGETANFCIISNKVVTSYRQMRENLRFFGALLKWMGFKTVSIEVEHSSRSAGKSSYTFKKLWSLACDTIIAYSDKPLKLCIQLGLLISFISFCYGIYVLLHALFHGSTITGWSSLIISIYFIGGITIATLGIMGIYLGKVFDEVKKRPLYIIKEFTSS